MNKTEYTLFFYRKSDNSFLECRQCSHMSEWQAAHEAELYAKWAEYHYGCRVVYKIAEQKAIFSM